MKLYKIFSFILSINIACISASATDIEFSKESFTTGNITLPYRKADIQGTGSKASLVVYLHGGSSKGSDNETQMQEPAINDICNYLISRNEKAIMLVPQCPKDKSWLGTMLSAVHTLLSQYVSRGVADVDKVYCFGGSMGGTGTWNMIAMYPEMFAAAMPVAGNPSGLDAEKVAQVPLFTVMGTADKIMSISPVENFLHEMDSYNAQYQFETEEGWSHEDTCKKSYTTERLDWVFSHVKDHSGINEIGNDTADITSVSWYDLSGKILTSKPSECGVYIECVSYSNGTITNNKIIVQQ